MIPSSSSGLVVVIFCKDPQICADTPIHPPQLSIQQNVRFAPHGSNQIRIVACHHHGTIPLPKSVDQSLHALDIQMIGNLIDDEQLRREEHHRYHAHAATFTSAEKTDVRCRLLWIQAKPGQLSADVLLGFRWKLLSEEGKRSDNAASVFVTRAKVVYEIVHGVLVEVAYGDSICKMDAPNRGRDLSGNNREQRSLSRAILAQDGGSRPLSNR
mmetsp:Transcript_10260/g.25140  ORF Transcript_10260/g.25140 Transcript_10260/m.25140 type:complete len:213 (-) Transcript_10260:1579-2217(-)